MTDRALSPFALRMRKLLTKRRLSYSALGLRMGAFKSTCYRWASDQCLADTESLMRLSEALGVSIDFLLFGEEFVAPSAVVVVQVPARTPLPPPRLSVERIRPLRHTFWHPP